MAIRNTEKGIFDVYGMITYSDVATANIELRLVINRTDITSIAQNRSFLSRSNEAGYQNVFAIEPFTFETDGPSTFQLFHTSGLSVLAAVAGWLVVSQRN